MKVLQIKLCFALIIVMCLVSGCGMDKNTTNDTDINIQETTENTEELEQTIEKEDDSECVEELDDVDFTENEGDDINSEISDISESNIGDTVYFGSFEQDNNLDNGKEKIEWVILEKNGGWNLLLSKKALLCMKYGNNNEANIPDYFGYQNSELSFYLNDGFYDDAFSEDEQNYIDCKMIGCENTDGVGLSYSYKVFILGLDEINDYKDILLYKTEVTEYAEYYNNTDLTDQIWLRTTSGENSACYCDMDYNLSDNYYGSSDEKHFVCPAIWLYSGDDYTRNNIDNDLYVDDIINELIDDNIGEGDSISLGTYEQDDIIENGKEDISWIIIKKDVDNRQVLLISKDILDYYQYQFNGEVCDYLESDLWKSLNNDFYQDAFSDKEKSILVSFDMSNYYVDVLSLEEYNYYIEDSCQTISRYAKNTSDSQMMNQIRLYLKSLDVQYMDVLFQYNDTENEFMSQINDENLCRQYYHVRPVICVQY